MVFAEQIYDRVDQSTVNQTTPYFTVNRCPWRTHGMGKFKDLVGDNDCNPLVIRVKSEYRSLLVQLVPEYF